LIGDVNINRSKLRRIDVAQIVDQTCPHQRRLTGRCRTKQQSDAERGVGHHFHQTLEVASTSEQWIAHIESIDTLQRVASRGQYRLRPPTQRNYHQRHQERRQETRKEWRK